MDGKQRKKIYSRWMEYAPERWWGDFVDIRFFLAHRLRELRGKTVLDVGANIGVIAYEMAENGNRVVGLDTDCQALEIFHRLFAHKGWDTETVCGSMERPPFAGETFDTVVLGWSLYCLGNDERKARALERLASLVKPGGALYFVEANRRCYIQGHGQECFWTVAEACKFLESGGFRIKEVVGWNPLPSLVFWLPWRLKNALPRKLVMLLYPPGRLVRFLPGWYAFFKWIGSCAFAWKYCRSYYIHCVKTATPPPASGNS